MAIYMTTCDCGHTMMHLGKGEFICPKCGEEILLGYEDDYDDDEENHTNKAYSFSSIFGFKPEVCRTCGGNYPDCKDSCDRFDD